MRPVVFLVLPFVLTVLSCGHVQSIGSPAPQREAFLSQSGPRAGELPIFAETGEVEGYLDQAIAYHQAFDEEEARRDRALALEERKRAEIAFRELHGDFEEMIVVGIDDFVLKGPSGSEIILDAASLSSFDASYLEAYAMTPNLEILVPQSVTNNQELGVDEGDIVKRVGDYLIVLRRGRLYSIEMGEGQGSAMRVADRQNVFPFSDHHEAWYDELLVSGDRLIVLGFSYETEMTELAIFELSDSGRIRHNESYAIRSADYFSSENYGSRLVDGRLVLYVPLDLEESRREGEISWPAYGVYRRSGEIDRWSPLVESLEILQPLQEDFPTTLHTVVECGLDGGGLSCTGVGVMGGWHGVHYVSRSATYLWLEGARAEFDPTAMDSGRIRQAALDAAGASKELEQPDDGSILIRLPLDGSAIGMIELEGSPLNQFSFRENVSSLDLFVSRSTIRDDDPERRDWLRVDLARFYESDVRVRDDEIEILPSPSGGWICRAHRFVGEYLLYASCPEWGAVNEGDVTGVHAIALESNREPAWIRTSYSVDRIERVGQNVLLVGSSLSEETEPGFLSLTPVLLGDEVVPKEGLVLAGLTEAEDRSHAFNYTVSENEVLMGLPAYQIGPMPLDSLATQARDWWQAGRETVIAYFEMDEFGSLSEVGRLLEAPLEDEPIGNCKTSCEDWYGSIRPLFVEGRIFGLMGNSLVEAGVRSGQLREIQRVNLLRD